VPTELPFKRGAIELLILKTVSWRPMHGYAIAQWIQDTTDDALRVEEGSLYPALHRLENNGWIDAEWKNADSGREAKFYALTKEGKRQLARELESWERLSSAVGLLLQRT
jgi:PadR family transcriptional regulator, regulatory protein PadR